jgi:hypothetical protein
LFEEMSKAYRAMGDAGAAAVVLMEGVAMDNTQTQLASQLAELYGQTQPNSCAVTQNGGASSVNVDCPLVKAQMCQALAKVTELYLAVGRKAEAAEGEKARKVDMGCPE